MADISKIKVNDDLYDVKDDTARANVVTALAEAKAYTDSKVAAGSEVYSAAQPTGQPVGGFWSQIIN